MKGVIGKVLLPRIKICLGQVWPTGFFLADQDNISVYFSDTKI
jgi:hypothetical protein